MKKFFGKWYGKTITIFILAAIGGWLFMLFLYEPIFEWYTGVENDELYFDTSRKLSETEFKELIHKVTFEERKKKAEELTYGITDPVERNKKIKLLLNTQSLINESQYKHIKYFQRAGIRQYEGPKTCLKCHETMKVKTASGEHKEVNTLDDVLNTVHFRFQSTAAGFSTYGYDGRKVNENGRPIPVGKIDRACGIPGSFSWTGWAALVKTYPEHKHGEMELRSEGCGQCHIGGNYHPATEKMMPVGDIPDAAKNGIDCLICHSQSYDMNYKYVIEDKKGTRWNQDRTLKAAITVSLPSNDNCLNCHQHNMGGDLYSNNVSAKSPGYKNKRLLHTGAKRGNPFSRDHDVHAAAGVKCTDCHIPEGHKIPRGTKGTDLVANDLPGKDVSCEMCHTTAAHSKNKLTAALLNGHNATIACETCHIQNLEDLSVVLRDWVHPVWNKEEGIYTPADILRNGEQNVGYKFLWFNGNGTFLANALGNNPNKSEDYNPLMNIITGISHPDAIKKAKENASAMLTKYNLNIEEYSQGFINTLSQNIPELIEKRKAMIDKNIKPLQNMGQSKIYPFKIFNAMMYEDLNNQGPFGAMILPFDYPTYYETGKSLEAVRKAINHPIVKRMYQLPFKEYMMDEFMYYFGVDGWKTDFPIDDNGNFRNVEARWMRQYGTLMVNHGIKKEGRKCADCHSQNGILNFEELGYDKVKARKLRNVPEVRLFTK